jgi:choline dehydrogenase
MYWTHASQRDIDDWGKLGNPSWSWKSLLPYFLKSETYVAPSAQTAIDLGTNLEFDSSVHGRHGPVAYGFPEEHGPFQEAWWSESAFRVLSLALELTEFLTLLGFLSAFH